MEETCASCKWYIPGSITHPDHCLDRGIEPPDDFTCDKWLDYRQRIDAMTGEYLGPVNEPPEPSEEALRARFNIMDLGEGMIDDTPV